MAMPPRRPFDSRHAQGGLRERDLGGETAGGRDGYGGRLLAVRSVLDLRLGLRKARLVGAGAVPNE